MFSFEQVAIKCNNSNKWQYVPPMSTKPESLLLSRNIALFTETEKSKVWKGKKKYDIFKYLGK
jgi:hypothetical protein